MKLSEHFIEDLRAAVRAERLQLPILPLEPTEDLLRDLSKRLDALRERAAGLAHPVLERLAPSDPLRTPVGLMDAMGLQTDERAHTSTLAWLLSPFRRHGLGTTMLEAAYPLLTGIPDGQHLEVRSVDAERTLFDKDGESLGRLDILVSGSRRMPSASRGENFVIAIEAKVDANEGDEQLARYEAGIDIVAPDATKHLVFLTKDGHDAETSTRAWRKVSFADLATAFYRSFRELDPLIPGYHVLRYYLATVYRDLAGWQLPISTRSSSPLVALNYLVQVGLYPGEKP